MIQTSPFDSKNIIFGFVSTYFGHLWGRLFGPGLGWSVGFGGGQPRVFRRSPVCWDPPWAPEVRMMTSMTSNDPNESIRFQKYNIRICFDIFWPFVGSAFRSGSWVVGRFWGWSTEGVSKVPGLLGPPVGPRSPNDDFNDCK